MNRRFVIQLFCLIFFGLSVFSQENTYSKGKNVLLVMHPTVNTIAGLTSLVDNGIFPLKDIIIKGVCFSKETYDYSESEKFIRENKLAISLERIEGELEPGNLYESNPCSEDFTRLFNESCGIIFNGGPDIPPAIYGEKTSLLTVVTDPYRHYFESSFLYHLLGGYQDLDYKPLLENNPEYLVIGFCLGMQTMNVATGGTLVQDIPFEIYNLTDIESILLQPGENLHRNYNTNISDEPGLFWGDIHPIKILNDSWIITEGLVKNLIIPAVVSSHHQAVKKPGKDLKVVATSMDGKIIESVCHTRYPNVFGFQFHPEIPGIYDSNIMYNLHSGESQESLKSVIETGESYDFHLSLWSKFADVLNRN